MVRRFYLADYLSTWQQTDKALERALELIDLTLKGQTMVDSLERDRTLARSFV